MCFCEHENEFPKEKNIFLTPAKQTKPRPISISIIGRSLSYKQTLIYILISVICNFRSLKWICDFIVVQCSRPRQAHSKDLHSTIVAAFHCCKTWILHHPYLLQDKDCIATVLEVIELGISGTKSQAKTNEPVVMKDKKISQPASRRVK